MSRSEEAIRVLFCNLLPKKKFDFFSTEINLFVRAVKTCVSAGGQEDATTDLTHGVLVLYLYKSTCTKYYRYRMLLLLLVAIHLTLPVGTGYREIIEELRSGIRSL